MRNVPETSEIGNRLRAARERRGWNREALAFHSGISWSAIVQIESGRRRNLRPTTLSAVSDALGVSVDYLVHGTRSPAPMLEHRALIYDSADAFLHPTAEFISQGNERGEPVLAVLNMTKIERLRTHLGAESQGVEFADSARWLSTPGSALEGFRRFSDQALEGGASWVRVLGEPIWKGRSDAEVEQWTRFESLLNLVFAASPVSVLCPYDARTLDPEIVRAARVTHPHTVERDASTNSADYRDPGSFLLGSPSEFRR